jgi:hypothetical protein
MQAGESYRVREWLFNPILHELFKKIALKVDVTAWSLYVQ